MKRICFLGMGLLFFLSGGFAFSQSKTVKPADIVVLMDTSGTILQYYDDVNKRVLNEISDKFIRKGDNFHLLSFNASTRYEMSQVINTEADISRIVSRFLLMYPLGQNSDFLSALKYCKQYASKFPAGNDKIMIVISDGIFNPPPNSEFKNYGGEQVKTYIAKTAGDLRAENWKVYYVKLPFPSDIIIKDLDGNLYSKTVKDGSVIESNNDGSVSGNTVTESRSGEKIGSSKNNGSAGQSSNVKRDAVSGESDNNSGTLKNTVSNDDMVSHAENGGCGKLSENGNSKKEFVDVSSEFTESLGIETSELDEDEEKALVIEEDTALLPQVIFPDSIESSKGYLNFPLEITNTGNEEIVLNLEAVILDDNTGSEFLIVNNGKVVLNAGEKSIIGVKTLLPESYGEGSYHKIMRLVFSDNVRVMPQAAEITIKVLPQGAGSLLASEGYNFMYITLLLVFLLLLALFIFFLIRGMRNRTTSHVSYAVRKADNNDENTQNVKAFNSYERKNFEKFDDRSSSDFLNSYTKDSRDFSFNETKRTSAYGNDEKIFFKQNNTAVKLEALKNPAFSQSQRGVSFAPANHFEKINIKCDKSGMTEIFVANQNRNIGKRNIHVMKPGSRLYVGGGKTDDFLIFLVKFPQKLAQVRYDGQDYHLAILKPEYFPYESSNVINNCIGKTITIVSDKGYHVYFTFRGYEDPAVQLNNILKSIDYK